MKKHYWFRAKQYGWGWYPSRWQGWLVLFVWVGIFSAFVSIVNIWLNFSWWAPVLAILIGFVWVAVLIAICWVKGEPPRWQWGNKQDESDHHPQS